MTFILSEDEALKAKLQGCVVDDHSDNERPVEVWFGQPDIEIREQKYPYITIDLIDVSEARERVMVHAGVTPWYYEIAFPELDQLPDDWTMPYPIPINLDYQITSFSRSPIHDRQILGQLIGQKIPFRFGWLNVTEKTEVVGPNTVLHQTTRRLDMLGHYKRDLVENNKKMYMNIFTVRISSEIPNIAVAKYFYKVDSISLTQKSTYPSSLASPELLSTINITV